MNVYSDVVYYSARRRLRCKWRWMRGKKDLVCATLMGGLHESRPCCFARVSISWIFSSWPALSAVLIKSILQINNKQKCSAPWWASSKKVLISRWVGEQKELFVSHRSKIMEQKVYSQSTERVNGNQQQKYPVLQKVKAYILLIITIMPGL